jgi:putative peptidoglycan lipid II flippase
VARNVAATLRTTLTLIVPFALLLPVIALDVSNLVWGYGAARANVPDFAASLALFAPGLVFFTVHYLMLRGFYALERTRTVFWVQCVVAATNIVLAVVLTASADPSRTAPGLVLAYAGSYLVGAVGSYWLLRSMLGGLRTPELVRFLVRVLIAAGLATGAAWAMRYGVDLLWPVDGTKARAVVLLAATGLLDGVVFLGVARALRIREITGILDLVSRRMGRRAPHSM